MKTAWKTLMAVGLASGLWAQNEGVPRPFVFNQQTFEFVSGRLLSGPLVKGAPYSAEAVNETVQVLADGNRITQRSSGLQYRDSDGRERREEKSNMDAIFITDPVAGARFTLHPDSQTAEKGPIAGFDITAGADGNVFYYANTAAGVSVSARGGQEPVAVAAIQGVAGGRGGPGDAPQIFTRATTGRLAVARLTDGKTEQLGKMSIEGVQADGTRTTTTIPAGEIGNDKPINIVEERWYSPELQMTIMTKHSDPRSGETSFKLTNINRSNPPAYLFEIPPGYTLKTGPQFQPLRIEKRE